MLGFKICEIISISYNVCGAGKYCKEVAMRISILMFLLGGASRKRESTTEYRSTLVGCKCGIAPKVAIICY